MFRRATDIRVRHERAARGHAPISAAIFLISSSQCVQCVNWAFVALVHKRPLGERKECSRYTVLDTLLSSLLVAAPTGAEIASTCLGRRRPSGQLSCWLAGGRSEWPAGRRARDGATGGTAHSSRDNLLHERLSGGCRRSRGLAGETLPARRCRQGAAGCQLPAEREARAVERKKRRQRVNRISGMSERFAISSQTHRGPRPRRRTKASRAKVRVCGRAAGPRLRPRRRRPTARPPARLLSPARCYLSSASSSAGFVRPELGHSCAGRPGSGRSPLSFMARLRLVWRSCALSPLPSN